jgi:Arc/MetJ family transcription regulator
LGRFGTTLASNSVLCTKHIRRCIATRTNIVLDDELVKEAFEHSNAKTKRELVDQALREFVAIAGARTCVSCEGRV